MDLQTLTNQYKAGSVAKQQLEHSPLTMVVSITGGGKNALIGELLTSGKYHYVISHTTRKPRKNHGELEENGKEYWFVTEEEMAAKLHKGEFIEAKWVHEQYVYGTSIDELSRANQSGKTALLEIDVQGVEEIIHMKHNARVYFIVPPSFEEWQNRLKKRGEADNKELHVRLKTAIDELAFALGQPYFTFAINDDLQELSRKIITQTHSIEEDVAAREVAKGLIEKIKEYLSD